MKKNDVSLNRFELRASLALSAILFFRLVGVFMALPVLAVAASYFHDASALLVGLSLGIVGLSQALLQLPLGMLSDRIGRKPVIIFGFLIFIVGSLVAASAESIYGLILGRALQGMGAISSAAMALMADLVRPRQRSQASMFIGLSIGAAFFLAFLAAPILQSAYGLRGVFYAAALGGCIALLLIVFLGPSPARTSPIVPASKGLFAAGLAKWFFHKQLLRLHVGVFVLHATLTVNFMVMPFLLSDQLQVPLGEHWKFYLPSLALSFLIVFPLLRYAERKSRLKRLFLTAVFAMAVSQFLFFLAPAEWLWLIVSGLIFFLAFNFLEASLPALVSRVAPVEFRGACMGVFSSCQFAGIFVGGLLAGVIKSYAAPNFLSLFALLLCFLWAFYAVRMEEPPQSDSP